MASGSPRSRILAAALQLVSEGGYDALQVRAIAQKASVSSRTIYTLFPSLDSLLIIAVAEQAGVLYFKYMQTPPKSRTAAARVQKVIEELTEIMTANRTLTAALLRALLCGKPDVAVHVRNFAALMEAILGAAIAPKGQTDADREAAQILERVWFSALVGWATGVDRDAQIPAIMRRASLLILP